jgi:hypothetical protein
MADSTLSTEERLDRLEMAVEYMAQWLVDAQLYGFTNRDTDTLEKIKRGDEIKNPEKPPK